MLQQWISHLSVPPEKEKLGRKPSPFLIRKNSDSLCFNFNEVSKGSMILEGRGERGVGLSASSIDDLSFEHNILKGYLIFLLELCQHK